jgi:septal ring factor EnvC (AmiA/AmiB activator)
MPDEQQPSGVMPAAVKPNVSGDQAQQPGAVVASAPAGDAMSLDQALAELEKARKALKETNAESAGRRKRLEELESAEQARLQAQMSDAEKATAALQKLQEEIAARDAQMAGLREQTVRYEVMLKAQEMAIIDLDAAARLMDRDALEFGADGKPTNVEAVLKALVKAKPYLVKPSSSASGMGTPPGRAPRAPAPVVGQAQRRVQPL